MGNVKEFFYLPLGSGYVRLAVELSEESLIEEYTEVEDFWYQSYEDQLFHWEINDDDPIHKQKEKA